MKQCNTCKQWKDESEFHKDVSKEDGKATRCKACIRYLRENPEPKTSDRNEQGYKYCKFCNTWQPESNYYRKSNTLDGLDTRCKHCNYLKDRKNINKRREYNNTRKEYIKQYQKEYWNKNRERLNAYNREKWNNNINFKISNNVSGLIRHVLKTGTKAERHWETLVPYSLEDLMRHLESQFTPPMSWDNYGTYWEIDHIIPQNLFNIQSSEDPDFQICWSLANLRSLEKSLNRQRPKDGSDISQEIKDKILQQEGEIYK